MNDILSLDNLFTTQNLLALITLTALEIVLGIDNIVFISILTGKLPEQRRDAARRIGLSVAMLTRIALLLAIKWIMGLTTALFTIHAGRLLDAPHDITGKDLVLVAGGLFLIVKATKEIHHKIDGGESASGSSPDPSRRLRGASFAATVVQIILIDIVFSLDSVITAVGMAKDIRIMIAAVVIAVGVMLAVSGAISTFIERHPTLKMLALSFLLLIGVLLVADGMGQHIPKGYVYFAMAFSLAVEVLNINAARRRRESADRGAT